MSRIFRRGTSNTAEPANGANNNVKRDGTTTRNRASSDAPSLQSAAHSPERRQTQGSTRPQQPGMSPVNETSLAPPIGQSSTTPGLPSLSRFDETASGSGHDIHPTNSPFSTAKRGSTSSSAQASTRRKSSNPPSPLSETTHLPDGGKPAETYPDDDGEYDFGMDFNTKHRSARESPLLKRLGEENPFVLPHQTRIDASSQMYPGVVIGSFAGGTDHGTLGFGVGGMGFDGSMDDIMNPNAASQSDSKQRTSSGQAGTNIAPWLTDDTPDHADSQGSGGDSMYATTGRRSSPSKQSGQGLNHFISVPALPNLKRHGTTETNANVNPDVAPFLDCHTSPLLGTTNRVASSSEVSLRDAMKSRKGSNESVQTLSAMSQVKKPPSSPMDELPSMFSPGGGRHSSATGRASRYGSAASTSTQILTGDKDKKKGFLGGFLKRKTGQSVSQGE